MIIVPLWRHNYAKTMILVKIVGKAKLFLHKEGKSIKPSILQSEARSWYVITSCQIRIKL